MDFVAIYDETLREHQPKDDFHAGKNRKRVRAHQEDRRSMLKITALQDSVRKPRHDPMEGSMRTSQSIDRSNELDANGRHNMWEIDSLEERKYLRHHRTRSKMSLSRDLEGTSHRQQQFRNESIRHRPPTNNTSFTDNIKYNHTSSFDEYTGNHTYTYFHIKASPQSDHVSYQLIFVLPTLILMCYVRMKQRAQEIADRFRFRTDEELEKFPEDTFSTWEEVVIQNERAGKDDDEAEKYVQWMEPHSSFSTCSNPLEGLAVAPSLLEAPSSLSDQPSSWRQSAPKMDNFRQSRLKSPSLLASKDSFSSQSSQKSMKSMDRYFHWKKKRQNRIVEDSDDDMDDEEYDNTYTFGKFITDLQKDIKKGTQFNTTNGDDALVAKDTHTVLNCERRSFKKGNVPDRLVETVLVHKEREHDVQAYMPTSTSL